MATMSSAPASSASSGNAFLTNPGQAGTTFITNTSVNGNLTVIAPSSTIRVVENRASTTPPVLVTLNAGVDISQGSFALTAGGGLTASQQAAASPLTNAGQPGRRHPPPLPYPNGAVTFTNSINTTLGSVTAQNSIGYHVRLAR